MSTPSPSTPSPPPAEKARKRLAPPKPGNKRGKGVGCCLGVAAGCGGVMLLAFVGLVAAAWWAMAPGQQIDSSAVISERSVGALSCRDLAADPGVRDLTLVVVEELQRAQSRRREQQGMPEWLRRMVELRDQSRNIGDAQLQQVLPTEITLSLEAVDGSEEPAFVLAVNLRQMPRAIFFGLVIAFKANPDYRAAAAGHRVHIVDGLAFSRVGGTILAAGNVDVMRTTLGRVEGARPSPAAQELARELVERQADFAGFLTSPLLIRRLAERFGFDGEAASAAGIDRLRLIGDVQSADIVRAVIDVDAGDPEARARVQRWLARAMEGLRGAEPGDEPAVEVELSPVVESDAALQMPVEIRGVEAVVRRGFARLAEDPGSPPPE